MKNWPVLFTEVIKIMLTVEEFKARLKDPKLTDLDIVRGYITHGNPYVFQDDEEKYFEIKKRIATKYDINPQEVLMVGSAKLGFSMSPMKLWKPFDEDSDIDMVIISANAFDATWKTLFDFNINLTARAGREDKQYQRFLDYFFKGWLRPDVFPFTYLGKQEWEEFFNSISYGEFGNRKITGAIFRSFDFYEHYQVINIKTIRAGGVL